MFFCLCSAITPSRSWPGPHFWKHSWREGRGGGAWPAQLTRPVGGVNTRSNLEALVPTPDDQASLAELVSHGCEPCRAARPRPTQLSGGHISAFAHFPAAGPEVFAQ